MSDEPISAPESIDAQALQRAGWSNAELIWEQIQEAAAESAAAGAIADAEQLWQGALEVAREYFAGNDPRLATSLVNSALARSLAGDKAQAQALLAEALAVWQAAAAWIAGLKPELRARSSTFHLRMQRKHLGAYDRFSQERYAEIAAHGLAVIQSKQQSLFSSAAETDGAQENRLVRWQQEKPAGLCDVRKLLGAVLLMAPPIGETS